MHLVKWIRKNERKLMAVVVILIMIAFVGGTALQQLLKHMGGGNRAAFYYGDMTLWGPRRTLKCCVISEWLNCSVHRALEIHIVFSVSCCSRILNLPL